MPSTGSRATHGCVYCTCRHPKRAGLPTVGSLTLHARPRSTASVLLCQAQPPSPLRRAASTGSSSADHAKPTHLRLAAWKSFPRSRWTVVSRGQPAPSGSPNSTRALRVCRRLVLAGNACGRVGFDRVSDAPLGSDASDAESYAPPSCTATALPGYEQGGCVTNHSLPAIVAGGRSAGPDRRPERARRRRGFRRSGDGPRVHGLAGQHVRGHHTALPINAQ